MKHTFGAVILTALFVSAFAPLSVASSQKPPVHQTAAMKFSTVIPRFFRSFQPLSPNTTRM